ncbi:MAG TPA: IclR family transcriptional regulator [bacterium]|nr:IclR family transcriptional regulator [bacterium]
MCSPGREVLVITNARTDEPRSYLPQALSKGLAILDCFSRQEQELTAADLSRKLGVRVSTLYRYLAVLEAEGYIERVPGTGKYTLGLRLVELGGVSLSRIEVRRHGQGELESLADATGLNANLGVLYRGDTLHLAFAVRTDVDRLYSVVGRRTPAHCTALGKAMLAYRPWDEVRSTIERYGWRPLTPNSIRDFERLATELDEIRARGYSVDHGEVHPTNSCVAAPIRTQGGSVVAAISVSGPSQAFQGDAYRRVVEHVTSHADRLSLRLGYAERTPVRI